MLIIIIEVFNFSVMQIYNKNHCYDMHRSFYSSLFIPCIDSPCHCSLCPPYLFVSSPQLTKQGRRRLHPSIPVPGSLRNGSSSVSEHSSNMRYFCKRKCVNTSPGSQNKYYCNASEWVALFKVSLSI